MIYRQADFNIHDTLTPLLLRAIKHHERKLAILLVRSPKVATILNKTFERKTPFFNFVRTSVHTLSIFVNY